MRIKPRLAKLELITRGCPECGGPPTRDTPLEIKVGEAHPDKPEPPVDNTRCDHCGRPLYWTIKVRGMPRTGT
jgi:endogenous inhibitor of DNA gyrase (YacG/DUF329 family)